MKHGILVCGLAGLLSAFVGHNSVVGARFAMPAPVVAYVLGFILVIAIGAWRLKKPMLRWHAIVALIGTCLSLMIHRGALGELVTLGPIREGSLAGILYALALYGGIMFSVGAIAKPER